MPQNLRQEGKHIHLQNVFFAQLNFQADFFDATGDLKSKISLIYFSHPMQTIQFVNSSDKSSYGAWLQLCNETYLFGNELVIISMVLF
jgi:hypothetical protein